MQTPPQCGESLLEGLNQALSAGADGSVGVVRSPGHSGAECRGAERVESRVGVELRAQILRLVVADAVTIVGPTVSVSRVVAAAPLEGQLQQKKVDSGGLKDNGVRTLQQMCHNRYAGQERNQIVTAQCWKTEAQHPINPMK
eukprot:CAMPEP_0184304536 /NCGR_PEP_ID=MMETSP1049-20130417/14017_1 /TAXON_ID=77928 /ORGANISM="Proteomonas sulcata, Strain CCMP704" /LENGTH=141 /DNA_ID=CAMNT_0026616355 /DNA_START=295 /DNA_END=720 /DNA_ORIENTATION=-